ncbi:MAG: hypothetical protein J6U92_01080, partial [Clostridia bacterium]|nr:hypothetical protein [Clostridia bacterium]
ESIEDAYGKLPEETDNLVNIAVAKTLASKLSVKEINVRNSDVNLVFADFKAFADPRLIKALDEFNDVARVVMTSAPTVEFERESRNSAEMLKLVREFLSCAVL